MIGYEDSPQRLAASMGPPEFTGGNQPKRNIGRNHRNDASMGPPEFTGGNKVQRSAEEEGE